MRSRTRCGTCVPPGPSRNAAGWPLTAWESAGNWARMEVRSRAGAIVAAGDMVIYFYHEATESSGMRFPIRDFPGAESAGLLSGVLRTKTPACGDVSIKKLPAQNPPASHTPSHTIPDFLQ